jgi:hypothetical protein
MNRYTHVRLEDEAAGLRALPDLDALPAALAATGTTGRGEAAEEAPGGMSSSMSDKAPKDGKRRDTVGQNAPERVFPGEPVNPGESPNGEGLSDRGGRIRTGDLLRPRQARASGASDASDKGTKTYGEPQADEMARMSSSMSPRPAGPGPEDPKLEALRAAWPRLPAATRARILALIGER